MIATAAISKLTDNKAVEARLPSKVNSAAGGFASQVHSLPNKMGITGPGFRATGSGEANADIFTKFEAIFLNNFVESILPKASEASAFSGSGSSDDYWNSMFADKISDAISKSGRFGIADNLRENYFTKTEAGYAQ